MPPAALSWLTARLTPRHSNWPRSLDAPLCASTTAILIGPAAGLPLEAAPVPVAAGGLLLAPGALHAAAARAAAATSTAEPKRYLCLLDMCPPSETSWAGEIEDAGAGVRDVPAETDGG